MLIFEFEDLGMHSELHHLEVKKVTGTRFLGCPKDELVDLSVSMGEA